MLDANAHYRVGVHSDDADVSSALLDMIDSLGENWTGHILQLAEMDTQNLDACIFHSVDNKDQLLANPNRLKAPNAMRCIILSADSALEADTAGHGTAIFLKVPIRREHLLSQLKLCMVKADDTVIMLGEFSFDSAQLLLVDGKGDEQALTEKEAQILQYLLAHKGKIVSRDTLLREIWGYSAKIETHTLATHIYTLRQKLEHDSAKPTFLISENGGYRLRLPTT